MVATAMIGKSDVSALSRSATTARNSSVSCPDLGAEQLFGLIHRKDQRRRRWRGNR